MLKEVKEKLNNKLSGMASEIQVNSSSALIWGEVELPECVRVELENSNDENKKV